ncbi:formate hydrogenlyase subunit 3 [Izhakiella capsodis]|uniref:Formate hydrogenlyase subunit 3 n=1 Tax=Izhakiella capsodis TaxID=1367852 RepID=A0A1I4ZQ54_9GAMM|nr:formate hydrogenlyase subunit 3 [Izhakiella capsodis]SFN52405.1 formate hydrogenlyase subunit 3 [Izhakiella capsodis]
MNVITLINGALLLLVLSGLLAGALARFKTLSGLVASLGGTLGCLLLILVAVCSLAGNAPSLVPFLGGWLLQLSAINAFWLLIVGIPGLFVCLFNLDWLRHHQTRPEGLLINLLLAAAALAVTAANLAFLVLMAEVMALCALFLTGCQQSGKLWFALGRLGSLLLVLMCILLWRTYGTLDMVSLHLLMENMPMGSGVRLLGLLGFGLLAGIIPLHGWVPQAHANASAPAAALFSAVVMKVGLYGILSLSLLDTATPLWWALTIMLLGMLTAFIGGLYALLEHNIHRLLAYHTLENIGIILLGMGAGLAGYALHSPLLVALGMVGCLFHLFNHGLFKTTLYLGAGTLWLSTGLLDIEKLGGIGKRMPLISLAMLTGLMAMAALPPLNGFASEWIIYQSFFHLGEQPLMIARLLGPLLATGLAITGALAVMCMAKVYGVTFLGAPRSPAAQQARPTSPLASAVVVILALCCTLCGISAPWLLPYFAPLVTLPPVINHTFVFQPVIALVLISALLLPFICMLLLKGGRLPLRQRGSAWACGYQHEPTMVITAHGFARPVKAAFAPLINLRQQLNPVRWLPCWQAEALPDLFRRLATIELAVLLVVLITRSL